VRDGGARDTPWGCRPLDDADVEVKGRSTSVYRSPNSSSSSIRKREGERVCAFVRERETEGLFGKINRVVILA
jgi:hypothetical protein